MNIFDQILASGYYAFDGKLNSHLVRMAFTFLRKNGVEFKRDDLVMNEIKKYMYFDLESKHYLLKEGYTISDLGEFIDINLITMFHNLKRLWDNHHSRRIGIEEPNFESAMRNIVREEPAIIETKKLLKRK